MQAKHSFFLNSSNYKEEQVEVETPITQVVKILDALIAYNKSLAEQALMSKHDETAQLIISMYLELDDSPIMKQIPEDDIKTLRKALIMQLVKDISQLQGFKDYAQNVGDIDCLYLRLFLSYRQSQHILDIMTVEELKCVMAKFYKQKEVDTLVRRIQNNIKGNNFNSPIMTEINMLHEMAELLSPQISAYCLSFSSTIGFDSEGNPLVPIVQGPNPAIDKKAKTVLYKYPQHTELKLLMEENISLIKSVNNECFTKSFIDNCTKVYITMKAQYLVESKIKLLVEELSAPKVTLQEKSSLKTSPQNKIQAKEIGTTNPVKIKIKTETETETETKAQNIPPTLKLDDKKIEPVPSDKVHASPLTNAKYSIGVNSELKSTKSPLADITPQSTPTSEDYEKFDYSYKEYPKKTKIQSLSENKEATVNILNLKKGPLTTYKEIYNSPQHKTISIRDLVQLTRALGGTLETTGANRCRIALKNIYAHALLSQNTLSRACDEADVTWHGGAAMAPNYLVKQFKEAFERAGYTPSVLGIELASAIEESSMSLGKK